MKRLCGVNPPVITIFDEHHKVDIEASKRQADFLISKGVDGLAYLGTSGEFSIMTVEEKKNFINEMIKYVNGRVNVIVGVGDTCLENTMDLLKFVEQAGADGVLLINPYFSVYSTDMVEAYFGYVASHTSLPIIIYNFPDLTGYCFNADVVARIVKANPNVVGIKDTIADFNHVLSMQKVKEINPDFSVFSAYENQAMGLLVCGVDGFINATANFAPEYTVNTYQSAKRGDFNEAAKWFNKKAVVTVTPVLRYAGGEAWGTSYTYQGEKVKGNNQVIPQKAGANVTMKSAFTYKPEMKKSELYLTFDAKIKNKTVKLPDVKIGEGVIATSELADAATATAAYSYNYILDPEQAAKAQQSLLEGIESIANQDVAASPEYNNQRKRERDEKDKRNQEQANVAKSIDTNVSGTMPNGDPAPKRDPNDGGDKTRVAIGVTTIGAGAAVVESVVEGTQPQETVSQQPSQQPEVKPQESEKNNEWWQQILNLFQ